MLINKTRLIILLSLFLAAGAAAQSIEKIASPRVWLRGDQGTSVTGRWQDASGNQFDASAGGRKSPEAGGTLNYNKALVFGNGGDYMTVPFNLEGLSEITIIAVFQSADTTERGIWGTENALSRKTSLTTRRVTGPDSVTDNYGNNELLPVISTVVQNWKKATVAEDSAWIALGSSGSATGQEHFQGAISEFFVFDKVLGFLERRQIETYLALKYGISSSGNYVSSAEKVLWNAEEDGAYAHRITGIGRDDVFALYQKQAKSTLDTTDLLVLSAGTLAATNEKNTTQLSNQDFLVWGDNDGSLKADASKAGGLLTTLERKWLMNVSGATASKISTTIQLDLSGLPQDSLGYWLVIDRSGQGDFTADHLEYILPDSVSSDSIAFFGNVQWDTDLSGKDMFGFANAKDLFAVVRVLKEPVCTDPNSGKIAIEVIGGSAPVQYEMTARDFSRTWSERNYSEQDGLAAARYAISIKDGGGEAFTREFLLTMPDALAVDLGQDRRVSEGEETTLDATTHIPDTVLVSYLWESNNGFTATEGKVTVTGTGLYKVTVTNQEGCEFVDAIALSGSSIQKFMVFPTITTTGDFTVGVSLEDTENVSVSIYDSKGNLYTQMNGKDSAEYLFEGHVSNPGMYLVVLKTPGGVESGKLIVN